MSVLLSPTRIYKSWRNDGTPNANGTMATYIAGTTTPQATWTDSTQAQQNSNPLIFNARGEANVWIDPTLLYKFVEFDSGGTLIGVTDDISGRVLSSTAGYVTNYGAVPGVDCTAAVTADAAVNSNVIFPAGAWVINTLPIIPTGVIITALPGATFTGAGAGALGLDTGGTIVGVQISDYSPPVAGELATVNIFRNPHYTGGPAGVNAGIRVQANVGANVTNLEWAILGIVNNSAAVGNGQNVGVYGQGNKGTVGVRAGPTWGIVAEARDKSGLSDPTDGLVGLEVDCFADGTDAHDERIGIDVVGGVGVSVGPAIFCGIRVGPQNGVNSNCNFINGLYIYGIHTRAINILSHGVVGIDVSGGVFSGAAVRLGATQFVSFSSGDSKTLRYLPASTGLIYASGGIDEILFLDSGGIRLNMLGTFTQIDGTQSTGTATPTLSANKPGANGGVSYWLSVNIGGTQAWVPAFAN